MSRLDRFMLCGGTERFLQYRLRFWLIFRYPAERQYFRYNHASSISPFHRQRLWLTQSEETKGKVIDLYA